MLQTDFDIKKSTTMKIGGKIARFYTPETIDEFVQIMQKEPKAFIAGNLSNVIVSSFGYDGAVISTKKLNKIQVDGNKIIAGAGVNEEPDSDAHQQVDAAVEEEHTAQGNIGGNFELCIHRKRNKVDDEGGNRTDTFGVTEHGTLLLGGAEHTYCLDKRRPEYDVGNGHEHIENINDGHAGYHCIYEGQHSEHNQREYQHFAVVKAIHENARGDVENGLGQRVVAHHRTDFGVGDGKCLNKGIVKYGLEVRDTVNKTRGNGEDYKVHPFILFFLCHFLSP